MLLTLRLLQELFEGPIRGGVAGEAGRAEASEDAREEEQAGVGGGGADDSEE